MAIKASSNLICQWHRLITPRYTLPFLQTSDTFEANNLTNGRYQKIRTFLPLMQFSAIKNESKGDLSKGLRVFLLPFRLVSDWPRLNSRKIAIAGYQRRVYRVLDYLSFFHQAGIISEHRHLPRYTTARQ